MVSRFFWYPRLGLGSDSKILDSARLGLENFRLGSARTRKFWTRSNPNVAVLYFTLENSKNYHNIFFSSENVSGFTLSLSSQQIYNVILNIDRHKTAANCSPRKVTYCPAGTRNTSVFNLLWFVTPEIGCETNIIAIQLMTGRATRLFGTSLCRRARPLWTAGHTKSGDSGRREKGGAEERGKQLSCDLGFGKPKGSQDRGKFVSLTV